MDLEFNDVESSRLYEITVLYQKYKYLALYAEELRSESFIPPINEIKDAYDHFMRIFAVKCGLKHENSEYIDSNLDATFRHIYRAVYDLLDYIRIYQKDIISNKLSDFSITTIHDVFPEYYQQIKPEIEKSLNNIPLYKASKDIGSPDIQAIDAYINLISEIKDYISVIDSKIPSMIEYEQKQNIEKRNNHIGQIIITLSVGLLCAAITYYLL
ncbi:hypothetical protein RJ40_08330 [Methanofollis aquaemaris]|uniref:Uncharacterized protein n=1 Tax=Methanofollis aquaemaris TaxID=126734 RepID=A0A8A3S766_9EURY|nr:hypothetical protein [Methanofollis aquaemaris]QSZ67510.1 hypothetical protein RJ40_08330 [Methanofollis aquaemaris]